MPQAMFDCVDRNRFRARLREAFSKAHKNLAKLHKQASTGPLAFELSAPEIIETNKWIELLGHVSKVKPDTTVESIQVFAIGEILRMAESDFADKNELRGWARIVDLTKPGSMQTSK